MFTLAMGLKVVPGADLALKYAPVAVKEKLENEIKNHYLKANFDFQKDSKLSLKVADYQITDGEWNLKEDTLTINIKGTEIPFTIQEVSNEKLTLSYTIEGQTSTLYLIPDEQATKE
ncbi:MAG: hypothetical protein ACFB0B_13805 [Thermonemataceae bacterium]